jgi:hypothetical protein
MEPIDPQMPTANARRCLGMSASTKVSPVALTSAPPTPWTIREAIKIPIEGATADMSEPTKSTIIPV